MRRGRSVARVVAALALLAAGASSAATAETTVEARDHSAFWLWAGVRPQPELDRAERVYLLEGEVPARGEPRLEGRRAAVPRVARADVWMVVRTETLDWTDGTRAQVLGALADWGRAGNRLVGLQVDFDAGSRHLGRYAAFLRGVRAALPPGCRLGVTGLLDWGSGADPSGLAALAGVVDEVVVQTYQGRHVIPGSAAYLDRFGAAGVPFRVGLLQGGAWSPPASLAANPWFRGYVVFLRNPDGAP